MRFSGRIGRRALPARPLPPDRPRHGRRRQPLGGPHHGLPHRPLRRPARRATQPGARPSSRGPRPPRPPRLTPGSSARATAALARPLFRDGPVRLFRIAGTVAGEQAWRHYVCSARIRTPERFNETSPGSDETLSTFRRSGRSRRVRDHLVGGESFDQALGWVDVRTGLRRLAWIRDRDEGPTVLAVAADERGGIAYLQDQFDDGAQRIGYARVRPDGRLAVPRPRTRVEGARVVPGSLAVSDGLITWTTRRARPAPSPPKADPPLTLRRRVRAAAATRAPVPGGRRRARASPARRRREHHRRAERLAQRAGEQVAERQQASEPIQS